MKKRHIALLPLALCIQSLQAEETKPWAFEAELGLISTSGNTETSSIKGKLDIKQDLDNWRNQYVLEGLYKEDEVLTGPAEGESQTTAHRWFGSVQSDYKLDDKHQGFFIYGSYLDDRFSGFDYQGTLAIGYSDRLFETTQSYLDYSVGPGISFTKVEDTPTEEGESDETGIVRISAQYRYNFSDSAKFTQTFSSDIAVESDQNTRTKAESAITANLNSSFALKASFAVSHNSEVPTGRESTDTQTAVTLVYSY